MANKVFWFPPADDVQPEEQNGMYQNSDYLLTSYFPIQPCICSGLAYTQTGTSNVITFTRGVVRWEDQQMGFTGLGYTGSYTPTAQAAFCDIPANTYTITAGTSVDQLYIVAVLTITINSLHTNFTTGVCPETFYADLTATISTTAMTLAAIGSSKTIVPIYTITNTAGVYTIDVDEHCIHNYGLTISPAVSVPVEITANTTLTYLLNNVIVTGSADIQVNMPPLGSLSQPYPKFTITNQTANKAVTINGNSVPVGTPDYTSVTIVIQRGSTITLELVTGITPFAGGKYWRIVDSFINQPDIVDTPDVSVAINKPLTVNAETAFNNGIGMHDTGSLTINSPVTTSLWNTNLADGLSIVNVNALNSAITNSNPSRSGYLTYNNSVRDTTVTLSIPFADSNWRAIVYTLNGEFWEEGTPPNVRSFTAYVANTLSTNQFNISSIAIDASGDVTCYWIATKITQ